MLPVHFNPTTCHLLFFCVGLAGTASVLTRVSVVLSAILTVFVCVVVAVVRSVGRLPKQVTLPYIRLRIMATRTSSECSWTAKPTST